MAVAADAMCSSGARGFPHCMVCSMFEWIGAIGSLLADNCATAVAKLSTTWSVL
jgi:hypothetical protein